MTEVVSDAAAGEFPAFFPAGEETLFGMVCRPGGEAARTGVVISSGGLAGTSTVGRNQVFVRLCRRLAADGLSTIRFDYHGIGESTGIVEEFQLDVQGPFVSDIVGAARFLQSQGTDRLVMIGKCFGSRMALAATPTLEHLHAVVLIGAPVRDFARRERTTTKLAAELSALDYVRRALRPATIRALSDPRRRKAYLRVGKAKLKAMRSGNHGRRSPGAAEPRWVSPGFIEPLASLVARGVPVLLIYGDEDEFYEEFDRATKEHPRLASLLENPLVDVTTVAGRVGDFVQSQVQEEMLDAACTWIHQRSALVQL